MRGVLAAIFFHRNAVEPPVAGQRHTVYMEAALHFKPAANTPIKTTSALDDDLDDVEVGSLPVGVEACLAVRRRNDDDRRMTKLIEPASEH